MSSWCFKHLSNPSKSSERRGISEAKSGENEEINESQAGRRVSGWEEGTKVKTKRRSRLFGGSKTGAEEKDKEKVESRSSAHKAFDDGSDDDTEVIAIPDIDEDKEEAFQLTVAEAPATRYALPTPEELERELPFGGSVLSRTDNSDEIDVSILLRLLEPPENIIERDEIWDRDQLFEQVSQELTKERVSHKPKSNIK